ncbi:MAG: cyclase family protein [Acidobacteria bacterium]|nr:cyclase family protein [Acidobacteriota bacterium]
MVVPKIIDLTYAFDERTIYWSAHEKFQHIPVAFGRTPAGYFYSSYTFAGSEHGGTHMDAPIHFAEGKLTVDQIPIERHIGPGFKISVADQAAQYPDYRITAADIQAWETKKGLTISPGAIVLIHTGWGRFWGDRKQYMGTDSAAEDAERHFPGIAQDAAEFLANVRKVSMVGIDTASLDHGPSSDFITHQVLNGANVAGLENVANLDQLPDTGYLVLALPMKIASGSGAPTRVVALLNAK